MFVVDVLLRRLRADCLTIVVLSACFSCSAIAAEPEIDRIGYFDLPGQPLQAGVVEFALQADITIIASHKLLSGKYSSPVVGPSEVDKALGQLLSNSELTWYYYASADAYVILEKPENEGSVVTDPPQLTIAPPKLDEVLVRGNIFPSRYTTISNTQLHSGVAYFDSARFLSILPQNLIQDQQPEDLADLLKYASGVSSGDGLADTNDDVFIRGFQRNATYIDGFRLGDWTGLKLTPATIEQAEILKGPSTLRYGQAEPGGIVNVVRKKPRADTFVFAQADLGSFGHRELTLDANGNLPFSEDAWFRIIAADEVQDELRDSRDLHRQVLSVAGALQVSADTAIDVGVEHKTMEQTPVRDYPVFLADGVEFPGATLEDVAKQAQADFSAEADFVSAEINHYLSPNWRIQANYFWHDEYRQGVRNSAEAMLETDLFFKPGEWGQDYLVLIPGGQIVLPILLDPTQPEWIYSIGDIRNLYQEEAWDTANNFKLKLEGSFDTGNIEHRFSTGFDWFKQEVFRRYTIEERNPYPNQSWTESEFSVAIFDIAAEIFDPARELGNLNIEERYLRYDDYGFYLQDNIAINENWILSVGTRYSSINGEHTNFNLNEISELQSYNRFSSQVGVVFKPVEAHSIYFNYSEALRANYHVDEIGSARTDPELSNQLEFGLKSQMFDGKLTTSLAVYQITKENVVELAIVDGARTELLAYEQRVSGLDVDASWQVTPKIDVIAAASLMSPEFVSGPYQNLTPSMTPEQTASLFINYQWREGLALNLGMQYVGERFADNLNQFYLDWYSRTDLGLKYQANFMEVDPLLRVSIKNLFDTDYYTAIVSGVRENHAQGRSIDLSISVNF